MSLLNLFHRPVPRATEIPEIPTGRRVYAFGDLHGRLDLLSGLEGLIARDVDEAPADRVSIIGLGDYIDRGDDSRRVVDRLVEKFDGPFDLICLRGNHEGMLLNFLERPLATGSSWIKMGGWECLRSYGVDCRWNATGEELLRIREAFAVALPPEHLAFYAQLPLNHTVGGYFFCHAGARPGVPLIKQQERDLLWIRDGFVDRDAWFEKMVVHGHTTVTEPFVGKHRINLDTGAYATGRLTCIVLEAEQRRFLEVSV